MIDPQQFLFDLGPYAALISFFNAFIAYRANPLRAVNRYFCLFCLVTGIWQLVVMMARVTKHYSLWGPMAAPVGPIIVILIFLIHDAAIHPYSSLGARFRRNVLAVVSGLIFLLGALLAYVASALPSLYPVSLRMICMLLLFLTFFGAHRARKSVLKPANTYDLFLFRALSYHVIFVFTVFMLMRTPLGSRVISGGTIIFSIGVAALLLSERVLDAKGTARVVGVYVVTFIVTVALSLLLLVLYERAGGDVRALPLWAIALLAACVTYPSGVLLHAGVRRWFTNLTTRAATSAREQCLAVAASADTETAISGRLETIAAAYLGGVPTSLVSLATAPHRPPQLSPGRAALTNAAVRGWISPESALHQYRGGGLDQLLQAFRTEHLGAVVKDPDNQLALVLFVTERAAATKPITTDEIHTLQELLAIAATGIQRVRAVNHAFRTRGLAIVGRIAAVYNHEARNRIEAIHTALTALDDNPNEPLPHDYIHAVRVHASDLAASHNLALELTRLRPESLRVVPVTVREELFTIMRAHAQFARTDLAAIRVETNPPEAKALADGPMLRQVLLNLLRNSVQAATAATTDARITLRVSQSDESVNIDVCDNGPGVSEAVHDQLFSPWVTTRKDGTGLGLSFCVEAMAFMGGSITYLTPRGTPNAVFRLTLPRADLPRAVSGADDHEHRIAGKTPNP